MTTIQQTRLRRILAYSLNGQYCYESCSERQRAEIDRLVLAIAKVFT
jgi:hypothetical protein